MVESSFTYTKKPPNQPNMMYKVTKSKQQNTIYFLFGWMGFFWFFFLVYFFLYNSHTSKTALKMNQQY